MEDFKPQWQTTIQDEPHDDLNELINEMTGDVTQELIKYYWSRFQKEPTITTRINDRYSKPDVIKYITDNHKMTYAHLDDDHDNGAYVFIFTDSKSLCGTCMPSSKSNYITIDLVCRFNEAKERFSQFESDIEQFRLPPPESSNDDMQIAMAYRGVDGSLSFRKRVVVAPTISDLTLHYGTQTASEIERFVKIYSDEDRQSLTLIQGKPGCGKTTMIRHIAHKTKRTLVVIPSSMFHNDIAEMFGFMVSAINNMNDVLFLIEDADALIRDQGADRPPELSVLLNLADGVMGEFIESPIIVTTNIEDAQQIDPAIMRVGRLAWHARLRPTVPKEDANKLAEILKLDRQFDKDVSLAEIYNEKI